MINGDVEVHDLGDVAYTLGVEHVDAKAGGRDVHSELRATNIYRRENNTWKWSTTTPTPIAASRKRWGSHSAVCGPGEPPH
jgi:ketosteroid isomerase-like protein